MFHHHGIGPSVLGAVFATFVFGLVFSYVCVCTFVEDTTP